MWQGAKLEAQFLIQWIVQPNIDEGRLLTFGPHTTSDWLWPESKRREGFNFSKTHYRSLKNTKVLIHEGSCELKHSHMVFALEVLRVHQLNVHILSLLVGWFKPLAAFSGCSNAHWWLAIRQSVATLQLLCLFSGKDTGGWEMHQPYLQFVPRPDREIICHRFCIPFFIVGKAYKLPG